MLKALLTIDWLGTGWFEWHVSNGAALFARDLGALVRIAAVAFHACCRSAVVTAFRLIIQFLGRVKFLLACAENKRLETITARKCLIFEGHGGYQESIFIMTQIAVIA